MPALLLFDFSPLIFYCSMFPQIIAIIFIKLQLFSITCYFAGVDTFNCIFLSKNLFCFVLLLCFFIFAILFIFIFLGKKKEGIGEPLLRLFLLATKDSPCCCLPHTFDHYCKSLYSTFLKQFPLLLRVTSKSEV
jgi:hypothetical protein